jgi:hypothetical protein
VALDDNSEIVESQQVQVGPMDRWSVHVAELIGIFYAISIVFKIPSALEKLRKETKNSDNTVR